MHDVFKRWLCITPSPIIALRLESDGPHVRDGLRPMHRIDATKWRVLIARVFARARVLGCFRVRDGVARVSGDLSS